MSLRKKKSSKKKTRRELRAIPLTVGKLTVEKHNKLGLLRAKYLQHQQTIASLLWLPDPLQQSRTEYEMYQATLAYNKQQSGFNKAYMQLAAMAAITAINEQTKRFYRQFWGRLRHVASEKGRLFACQICTRGCLSRPAFYFSFFVFPFFVI